MKRTPHQRVEMWQSRHSDYCYKSYSATFACAVCARVVRYNLNRVGNRRTVCCEGARTLCVPISEVPTYNAAREG